MASHTAILILAAGSASRMGRPKQLLPFGEGHLLGTVIDQASKADFGTVFCVLGANYEAIAKTLDPQSLILMVNENWENGLGSSIAKGVGFIQQNHPGIEAILIILADQPLIDSTYLVQMIALREKNPAAVIASDYGGFYGVPALFPKHYFSRLIELKGDAGAKKFLNEITETVIGIQADQKITDIDTPEDYVNILGKLKR